MIQVRLTHPIPDFWGVESQFPYDIGPLKYHSKRSCLDFRDTDPRRSARFNSPPSNLGFAQSNLFGGCYKWCFDAVCNVSYHRKMTPAFQVEYATLSQKQMWKAINDNYHFFSEKIICSWVVPFPNTHYKPRLKLVAFWIGERNM